MIRTCYLLAEFDVDPEDHRLKLVRAFTASESAKQISHSGTSLLFDMCEFLDETLVKAENRVLAYVAYRIVLARGRPTRTNPYEAIANAMNERSRDRVTALLGLPHMELYSRSCR